MPANAFTGPTNVSETAKIWCRVSVPGTTKTVQAMATIKPRIVVSHARNGEWSFNGQAHMQPEYYEDADVEAEKSMAKWGTDELIPDSIGFIDGEGYAADLVMTSDSVITLPGTRPNVIDQTREKTALAANTKPENYELYYLGGTLTVTPAVTSATISEVKTVEPWDSEKGTITVDYSLAGIDTEANRRNPALGERTVLGGVQHRRDDSGRVWRPVVVQPGKGRAGRTRCLVASSDRKRIRRACWEMHVEGDAAERRCRLPRPGQGRVCVE